MEKNLLDIIAQSGIVGAGGAVFVDAQDDSLLAVQTGVAGACIVNDGDGGHIGKAHIADAIHADQQRTGDVLHGFELVAYLQKPAVVVLIVDVTGGHGEILRRQDIFHHIRNYP